MKVYSIDDRSDMLLKGLSEVWKKSVKATHLFLSDEEIHNIEKYVSYALRKIPHLIIIENNDDKPIAFMGISQMKLEMLFITPEERGKGFGKHLIQYGIENYGINELCVNEQNPQAKDFYEHMGFQIYNRSDVDEQGNPYPIYYMRHVDNVQT